MGKPERVRPMNAQIATRSFDTEIDLLERLPPGWLLLGAGLSVALGGLIAWRRGWLWVTFRNRCGWPQWVGLQLKDAPIQFRLRIALQLVIGLALIGFGTRALLLEAPRQDPGAVASSKPPMPKVLSATKGTGPPPPSD